MSTLTQHHTSPAPWKADFLSHVSSMPSPEFVLSTVSPAPAGATVPYVPRARYCIFRGMWAELPENKHNTAPANPRVYGSDLPTFTTDVRMEKVGELFSTSAGKADRAELLQGSGGGGPVEAVWWVKDKSVQWRVKGEAFVVHAGDIEEAAESSGVRTVKSEVGKRMYVVEGSEGKEGEWSWGREIVGHFGNCSPGMRGSWKQPPPGQPKDKPYNDKDEKMGEKVDNLDDPVARKHFRVVVIRPEEVEMTDLNPESSRRERFTVNPDTLEWSKVETWP